MILVISPSFCQQFLYFFLLTVLISCLFSYLFYFHKVFFKINLCYSFLLCHLEWYMFFMDLLFLLGSDEEGAWDARLDAPGSEWIILAFSYSPDKRINAQLLKLIIIFYLHQSQSHLPAKYVWFFIELLSPLTLGAKLGLRKPPLTAHWCPHVPPVERLFLSLPSTLLFGQLCCDSLSEVCICCISLDVIVLSLLAQFQLSVLVCWRWTLGVCFPFSAVGEKEGRTWSWESRWLCSLQFSVCFFWTSLAASQFPKTWIGAKQIRKNPTTWKL